MGKEGRKSGREGRGRDKGGRLVPFTFQIKVVPMPVTHPTTVSKQQREHTIIY